MRYEPDMSLLDMSQIMSMKSSESKISISVESYDEITAENDRNCYVAKRSKVSKPSKHKLETWIKIVNKPSKNVKDGLSQVGSSFSMIHLVLKWSLKVISIFLKALEHFECPRADILGLLIGTSLVSLNRNEHNLTKNIVCFWFCSWLHQNVFQKILMKWKKNSLKKKSNIFYKFFL